MIMLFLILSLASIRKNKPKPRDKTPHVDFGSAVLVSFGKSCGIEYVVDSICPLDQ
jgi:hypothetical protein